MIIVSRTVGNCLTENKRDDYDTVVTQFTRFISFSQFVRPQPTSLDLSGTGWEPSIRTEPRCSAGDILYGLQDDGTLVFLMSVIDSSD